MRIILAGSWLSEIHEASAAFGLEENGCVVHPFKWAEMFSSHLDRESSQPRYLRFQEKYHFGPAVRRLNHSLVEQTLDLKPEALWVYRGVNIWLSSLARIRRSLPGIRLVSYNNDNAFSPQYPRWMWRVYRRALPIYDLHFVYRSQDAHELKQLGMSNVSLLLPWFDPRIHHPVALTSEEADTFDADVSFVGHYEDDGRAQMLQSLVNLDLKVRVWGPSRGWSQSPVFSESYPLRGLSYSKAISGARVSLVFLSRLNRDLYTRRCFEIPAIGSPMIAPRNPALEAMFSDQVEVGLFRGVREFADQVFELVQNADERRSRSRKARERVWNDGHDVVSRMQQAKVAIERIGQ